MSETDFDQAFADMLLSMKKKKVDEREYSFPNVGELLRIELESIDLREKFLLDVRRSRMVLSKCTYQNRAKGIVILARLDIGGAPHRNPDDEEIDCPHIHIYKEGYGDKYAIPLPKDFSTDPDDLWELYTGFLKYTNVIYPPIVLKGLFS